MPFSCTWSRVLYERMKRTEYECMRQKKNQLIWSYPKVSHPVFAKAGRVCFLCLHFA